MKKNVTYVDACHFERLIIESGLAVKAQAGFVKVSGAKGRNVYVARTKKVGRVDISGFLSNDPCVITLDDDEAFGNVRQQLDFSLTEDSILGAFENILKELAELGPADPVARPGTPSDAVGWTRLA